MGQENIRVAVSNSITLGATDAVSSGGYVSIVELDPYKESNIESLVVRPNLTATPMVYTATATGAASTTYEIDVEAAVNNNIVVRRFQYTTGTAAAATEAAALVASFNAWKALQGFDTLDESASNILASNVSTAITFAGTADSATCYLRFLGVTNVTASLNMPTIAPHATPGTALVGTTTVTVTTSAAQSFKTGETVTITDATGFTFTKNGIASVASVTARIVYVTGTNFTLDGVTGSGTNTGTIVITKVAQAPFGTPDQVTADLLANGSDETATQTTYNYGCVEIYGSYLNPGGSLKVETMVTSRVWYPQSLIAPNYTAVNAAFITAAKALQQ